MKDDMMMRFEPLDSMQLLKGQGASPKIGKTGNELKMHNVDTTVIVQRELFLNGFFAGLFASKGAMRKSEAIAEAVPDFLKMFGNETEYSASVTIGTFISWFTDREGFNGGFTKYRLERVA